MVPQFSREVFPVQGLPERPERKGAEDSDFGENGSKILSTVCHELRTPLAIIRGYTTLLLDYDGSLKNVEKREYVELIDKATSRLAELADHILDVSCLKSHLLKLAYCSIWVVMLDKKARGQIAHIKVWCYTASLLSWQEYQGAKTYFSGWWCCLECCL